MVNNWFDMENAKSRLYQQLDKASGLRVGDRVKVIRKAKSYEAGWNNAWCPIMDECIGELHTITGTGVYNFGYLLDVHEDLALYWPVFVLEKVIWG